MVSFLARMPLAVTRSNRYMPQSIILNLGISPAFQRINWPKMTFPGHLLIDYVRVRHFLAFFRGLT